MSSRVEHYVLWFEVAVDDPMSMQILYGEDEFCYDDQCCFRGKDSVVFDVLTEVSSRHVFEGQV